MIVTGTTQRHVTHGRDLLLPTRFKKIMIVDVLLVHFSFVQSLKKKRRDERDYVQRENPSYFNL